MKKILTICLLAVAQLLSSAALAQSSVTLYGKVVNSTDNQPIVGAYVIINATQPDFSSRTVLTDAEGGFKIVTKEKSPTVTFSYLGLNNVVKNVTVEMISKKVADMGTIRMTPEAVQAEAVTVTARAPMTVLKGDTLQYNAAAFKTNPDASSEDLLKKMPGVTLDEDGNVEVNGQTVGKVYVDGKEYFADDPNVALKSLPADVVESMQTYEDKSDEAKFSGFDDGERIRTINIVTKAGVSASAFGKAFAGYGINDRYQAGLTANIFDNSHRYTIIGQSNNINNQGFTLGDAAAAGGGRGGMGGGTSNSNFATSVRGGVQTTNMAGFNYSGEFSKKFKLSGSYFFNNVNADQWRIREQNFISMPRDYFDTTGSMGYNFEHRMNLRIEWNPNETNQIRIIPVGSFTTNHGNSWQSSQTYMSQAMSNSAANKYATNIGSYNAGGMINYSHRFARPGRVLSVGSYVGASNQWGQREQASLYGSLGQDGEWVAEDLKQKGYLLAPTFNISGRVSYSEAISKSSRLSAMYRFSYNKTTSDVYHYNWDQILEDYDMGTPDPSTSNVFNRDQTRHSAGVGYNLVKGKVVLNANLNYEMTSLNDAKTLPRPLDQSNYFKALLPRVNFEFKPTTTQSFTANYSRSTGLPSVNQLQDVLNIDNPLQVYYGNPNLRQSYSDNLNMSYNLANPEKSTNLNLRASVSTTQDMVSTHNRYLTEDEVIQGATIVKGARVSTPVNLDGYFRAQLNASYGFRINPLMSSMSISGRYRYSTSPSMENNQLYKTATNSVGLFLALNSNISEKVDFSITYSPSLNMTSGTKVSFDRYIRSDLGGMLNLYLWDGFVFNVNATWRNMTGTQDAYSQHFALLNASVGYKFLKFRQAEVRLEGRDLLNQNRAFFQSVTDTYVEFNTVNILERYFTLAFSYKFDTRKNRTAANFATEERNTTKRSSSGEGRTGSTRPTMPIGMGGGGMGGGRPH